jgi:hypothetical protein
MKATKPGVDFPVTVLALGMLADIAAPLLLVPDVDLIVAIDLVDPAYHAPWYLPCGKLKAFPEIQRFIRHILTTGSDLELQCQDCLLKKTALEWPNAIRGIRARCTIVGDTYDERLGRWTLDFQYGAKVRRLLFYHGRDYVAQEWPPEARLIAHVLTVGSPFPAHAKAQQLLPRLQSRCLPEATVWASCVVLEDEPEGWMWSTEGRPAQWNRGASSINVWSFPLSAWIAKYEKAAAEARTCEHCRKPCAKRCQRCRAVYYCDAQCQKADFARHASTCKTSQQ